MGLNDSDLSSNRIEMTSGKIRFLHMKCRNSVYPRSKSVVRSNVPDDKVKWSERWDSYDPPEYTSAVLKGQPWADPDVNNPTFKPNWNTIDGKVNRQSFDGIYLVMNSYPLNIFGRTGLRGRGLLGRWGPNHAADPIVTRWKRDGSNKIVTDNANLPVLQFVAIKRRDSGEWAIPGGMVDPGEVVTTTLKREFLEEALNVLEKGENESKEINEQLDEFFKKGNEIYKGYVDDPRNTDNAWMETVAMHFHDDSGDTIGRLSFMAGDDAVGVKWLDLSKTLSLYANHLSMVETVARIMKCSW